MGGRCLQRETRVGLPPASQPRAPPTLTGEVEELRQRLHDNGHQGQVELGHVGAHMGVGEAGVSVVAAEQGVQGADGLFVQEKCPGWGEERDIWSCPPPKDITAALVWPMGALAFKGEGRSYTQS